MKNNDGVLDARRAAELRGILENAATAELFAKYFAHSSSEEYEPGTMREMMELISTNQATANVRSIFRLSQSPIETILFNSLVCSCLRFHMDLVIAGPPAGDFLKFRDSMRKYWENLFCCYRYYERLPDKSRPKTFLDFLNATAVATGGVSEEEAKQLANQAVVMLDIGQAHSVHVTLQPTFEGLDSGRDIRPDAVAWIPSLESPLVIIECDGYEFHGDKESFSKDRQRDRLMQSLGHWVQRYSGSEIYNQPIKTSSGLADFIGDTLCKDRRKRILKWEKTQRKRPCANPSPENIASWEEFMQAGAPATA